MGYKRAMVQDSGLARNSRVGDTLANPVITVVATDTALTMTLPQMLGGVVQYTGASAGRVLTTPTAADILAALPEMDIGDSYQFKISCTTGFAWTFGAGVGVTLAGKPTVPANTNVDVYVVKNSATLVTWNAL